MKTYLRFPAILVLFFAATFFGGCAGSSGSDSGSSTHQSATPQVNSISPTVVSAGATSLTLTITGTGFSSGSVVSLNGSSLTTTFVSATELQALVPTSATAAVGTLALTVSSPSSGGGTSNAVSLTVDYAIPTIASVSPANITAGAAAVTLDIKGTGFTSATIVNWNGQALVSALVSSTEITASVPSSALAANAANQITVFNPSPGGGTSSAVTFNVNSPHPVLSEVSPRNVVTGKQATVTLTGSGFEANSVVQWNGIPHAHIMVNSSTLQVVLTAADLSNSGIGTLVVTNPDPNGSSSAPVSLTVTSNPIPSISGVIISAAQNSSSCLQLLATFTGTNLLFGSTVQVNGKTIGNLGYNAVNGTYLPVGLVAQPGALSFTIGSPVQSNLISDPFAYPATSPTALALCATPSPTTVFPSSSFSFMVTPSEVNAIGNATVAIGALPMGITTSAVSAPLPAAGIQLHLQAAPSTAAGSYTIPLSASAGTVNGSATVAFTVSTSVIPAFSFAFPSVTELGISPGTSGSLQFTTTVNSSSSTDYDITPSISGLPAGVTATFSPATFSPGQSVTVTLTAAANAPLVQNVTVTLTGTPAAAASPASVSFILDVSQPSGSLPTSRTDFTSIAGTPSAAAYDAAHSLIFAANPSWNRVDVLSATTHHVLKHIPIFSPRGIDITQDDSTVWVQTAGQYIYSINTSSLQATQYSLPNHTFVSSGLPVGINTHDVILALSDGTLFLYFDDAWVGGSAKAGVFNPITGNLNVLTSGPISAWTTPVRSGDGTRVYAANNAYSNGMEVYDVASGTLQLLGSGTSYGPVQAVNRDGSVVIVYKFQNTTDGAEAYNQNLTDLGSLPCGLDPAYWPLNGGILFSADGTHLYEICSYHNQSAVLTIDPHTWSVLGVAPAMFTDPVGTSGYAGTSAPFGVDATGLIFGIQNYGVAFEDPAFTQNYIPTLQDHNGETEYIATFAGPLAGGTPVTFNVSSPLIPDVWFGQARGTAQGNTGGTITAITPPSTTAGVVNVKYNFPDGAQWYYPQIFSYGTNPEYAVTSGSSPNGGAAAQVLGYGLPDSTSGGTVTVGGNNATITTTSGQYPPLSGEPYPSTLLAYTFPSGNPGWADLQITTPNGTGTLPKSIFYAKSVTDYASSDTFTNVLYDSKRNQVYLSAGDHIDVFSLTSNSFISPLVPAALGAQRQFTGLALTPDGSKLLAADLLDGSLGIINPDSPSSTSAIAIVAPVKISPTCTEGPLYVAAAIGNTAFVSIGGLPGAGCPSYGTLYSVNLLTSTATVPAYNSACNAFTSVAGVDATIDGSTVFMPNTGSISCLYSATTGTYTSFKTPTYYQHPFGTISSRGNVLFGNNIFGDSAGDALSILASPIPYYGGPNAYNPPLPLLRPRLNASGSLLYVPYANWVDIIDTAHASLRMRFALTETISSTASPIAIDSGGQLMFLITNAGLTVVDLGAAPLSIGSVGQQTASVGSQVTLLGSGFNAQTTAKVGSVPALVTYTDENTLTITIPAVSSGPQDVILTRGDGTTYTLENAIILH